MKSLFDNIKPTSITAEANKPTPTTTPTGGGTGLDLSTQYLLLDLSDRRLTRAANVLQCIAALIAIIYFIQKLFKN